MRVFEYYFPEVSEGKKIDIPDLGGTINFWKQMGYDNRPDIQITLLNLKSQPTCTENIKSIKGDACNLYAIEDKHFDIVFSNSVIEHVGDFSRQKKMAGEIIRVGKGYFIQTPNYWLPLEPHFLTIGYQFLPLSLRVLLLRHFNPGWKTRQTDRTMAREIADSIHQLSRNKLKILFPDAIIRCELFAGLPKSFMTIKKRIT